MTSFEHTLRCSLEVLLQGGTILYPTDTVWGIGCDATNQEAVKQVFKIKKRNESKSLIILVSDFDMLQKYVSVPDKVLDFLTRTTRPTSVIYNNASGLAHRVIAPDGSVAVRMVKDDFCATLIQQFGKPIVSTSANISGQPTARFFSEIDDSIKKSVDYIVDYKQDSSEIGISSQLIAFQGDEICVLRA
ncbi:L-threonylcarbamoyladenylate synthase [Capnocytophaga catalasegens]|uniref:L-threonylcarbamoyladenylate synthase n=1 Tax=Capnocytophaga catalasegens TaxID=1004260 RepID=A0AAV5B0F7_9FLAO|nr:L-threonylcarbamoyladenylate synthase [Capnocytophaga catalasegens]GIZ16612.1 threonylcarbamoyl-AMP synthase [Capnocytophaga catalasegens]GJM51415.1 threonylcarbamoyl-AMP synthase [Capnocytophaga catalasegens]GJM52874.1 threonylcarbamoyl-AMP synthase [Capnocytophaga catalasegens]